MRMLLQVDRSFRRTSRGACLQREDAGPCRGQQGAVDVPEQDAGSCRRAHPLARPPPRRSRRPGRARAAPRRWCRTPGTPSTASLVHASAAGARPPQGAEHRVALAAGEEWLSRQSIGPSPATSREPGAVDAAQPRQRDHRALTPSPASSSAASYAGDTITGPAATSSASSPSRRTMPRPRTSSAGVGLEAQRPGDRHQPDVDRARRPRARPTRTAVAHLGLGVGLDQRHPRHRAHERDVAHRLVRVARARPARARRASRRRSPWCPRWRCCRSARWRGG